jgi:phosphate acetyltransferase
MKDIMEIVRKKAGKKIVTIGVCEGWDERCLKAVDMILKKKLARFVLVGDEKKIIAKAKELGIGYQDSKIINPKTYDKRDKLINLLYEKRKHKGMTLDQASKLIDDVNYFGCLLLETGVVDALVGSAIASTAELMRAAFQVIGTKEGCALVSEVTILYDPKQNRRFFASDMSLNVEPNAEQLAQIALNAAECVKSFDIEPIIGILSFSTKGSGGNHAHIDTILEAIKIAKKRQPKLKIDGEFQLDAAINEFAAKKKCPDSKIAGKCNTLIFPNLIGSNILSHGLLQLSEVKFEMSFLVGMRKPIVILGRSTPVDAVHNMILAAAMAANA